MSSSFNTDKNYRSIYEQDGYSDLEPEVINVTGYDDTLKVGKSQFVNISNKTISNDGEDCVDLVRVKDSVFHTLELRPFGRNGLTVKGASSNVEFSDLKFGRHGKECDIELGQFDNYWYPGRPPTQKIIAHGPGMAGLFDDPIRVRVWDAEVRDAEFFFDSGVKITRVPKWVWYPYFIFQYARIRVENVYRKLRNLEPIKTA
jgi:hypothetical protein